MDEDTGDAFANVIFEATELADIKPSRFIIELNNIHFGLLGFSFDLIIHHFCLYLYIYLEIISLYYLNSFILKIKKAG